MYRLEFSIPISKEDYYTEILYGLECQSISATQRDSDLTMVALFEEDIQQRLVFLSENGINYEYGQLDEEDWLNKWTDNYGPIEVNENIVIIPEDYDSDGFKQKYIIKINPENAFGAGSHATTRICMKALELILEELSPSGKDFNMLDIGTGNGILPFLANKMGVEQCQAFDYDGKAVKMAEYNQEINNITGIHFFQDDINSFNTDERYDLICANLLTKLLDDNIDKILSFLKEKGTLILSGIGDQWDSFMKSLFEEKGLSIVKSYSEEGWMGYILKLK